MTPEHRRTYSSRRSPRVDPYHSIAVKGPGIHHLYADCVAGGLIPPTQRRHGTNGWPACKICSDR